MKVLKPQQQQQQQGLGGLAYMCATVAVIMGLEAKCCSTQRGLQIDWHCHGPLELDWIFDGWAGTWASPWVNGFVGEQMLLCESHVYNTHTRHPPPSCIPALLEF